MQYQQQITQVQPFAARIHIDLMDGVFAPTKSPELQQVWWPPELQADIHLMYANPMAYLEQIVNLHPQMVVIHAEVLGLHHMHFAAELQAQDIKAGLAVLQNTSIEEAERIIYSFDQILIFSGRLGEQGGEADMNLLKKVQFVRQHHPEAEVAWDGGINENNLRQLIEGGVDVLNVGGYIQKAPDPQAAYAKLYTLLEDTNG